MFLLACFSMVIDHLYILFPDIIILRIIGRLAFPIFAYGISEGYKKTRKIDNYIIRLWILACVAQTPFLLYFKSFQFNVCFTLLMGLISIHILSFNINKFLKYLIVLCIVVLNQLFLFEFGAYGVLLIVGFHLFKDNKLAMLLLMVLANVVFGYYYHFNVQMFSILALPIIYYWPDLKINLSVKSKRAFKIFKYSFYPMHLIILYLIKISCY